MSRAGAVIGGVVGAAAGSLSGFAWNAAYPRRALTRDGTEQVGFLGSLIGAAIGAAVGAGPSCSAPSTKIGVGSLSNPRFP